MSWRSTHPTFPVPASLGVASRGNPDMVTKARALSLIRGHQDYIRDDWMGPMPSPEEVYQQFVDFFSKVEWPLTVYRVLEVDSPEGIDMAAPGAHWSLSRKLALLYGKTDLRSVDAMLTAQVSPADVDWESVVVIIADGGWTAVEQELTIKNEGRGLKNVQVEWLREDPVQMPRQQNRRYLGSHKIAGFTVTIEPTPPKALKRWGALYWALIDGDSVPGDMFVPLTGPTPKEVFLRAREELPKLRWATEERQSGAPPARLLNLSQRLMR